MKNKKLCIIGLGYVGLPLAVEFSKFFQVTGFDISKNRILELKKFNDRNNQFKANELKKYKNLKLTYKKEDIKNSTHYIITVPTPINKKLKPDLSLLIDATKLVAKNLDKGNYIIFESTVYPGCVENICIPIIQKIESVKRLYN